MCHPFLLIDRYNGYQSDQIYRFLSIKQYLFFLSIDNSGELRCICKKCFVPLKLTLVSPILRQTAIIQEL